MQPARLSLFLDLLNATDRSNVEELAYTENYRARRDISSIPIVAMAGFSVRYAGE